MRTERCRRALAVAGLGLLLAGCSAAPEAPPTPLTLSEAGTGYLRIVCPLNERWDRLDLTVDVLRQSPNPGAAELTAAKRAAESLREASEQALRDLDEAEPTWPAAAAPALGEVREQIAAEVSTLKTVPTLDRDAFLALSWPDAGDSAAQARRALDLDDDPDRNCAELPAEPPATEETPDA